MTPDNKGFDEILDAMLHRQELRARPNFTECVLEEFKALQSADAFIDSRLASRVVAASPGFTDRVMGRIYKYNLKRLVRTLVPAFALAASVAAVFLFTINTPSADTELASVYSQLAALDGELTLMDSYFSAFESYEVSRTAQIEDFFDPATVF